MGNKEATNLFCFFLFHLNQNSLVSVYNSETSNYDVVNLIEIHNKQLDARKYA